MRRGAELARSAQWESRGPSLLRQAAALRYAFPPQTVSLCESTVTLSSKVVNCPQNESSGGINRGILSEV